MKENKNFSKTKTVKKSQKLGKQFVAVKFLKISQEIFLPHQEN